MNQHKTQVWLYVILAAIITSCSPVSRREKDNLQKIDEAWDMSDHNLDSSIILFQNIQNSVYRSTEYVRMKYDLLGIRLRDKSYMMPTSADSIKRITEFMEKHGSKKDCMRAYYYMGATYADLNDSPRAVESTLKALSYREGEQSCDTAIAIKCYSHLSDIYRRLYNSQESIHMAMAGLELAKEAGMATSWYTMDVATSYNMAGDRKQGMEYCRKAYERLLEEKNYAVNTTIAAEMMYLFAKNEEYGKVDTLAEILEKIPGHEHSYNYNYAKGIVYEARGMMDSAVAYYTKDISIPSPHKRQASLTRLFLFQYNQGNYKEASEYALKYLYGMRAENDSKKLEWTRNSKGMYDYQRDKELEETLARENELMRFWGIIGFCILLIIIAGLAALHFYKEKRTMEKTLGKDKKLAEMQSELQKKMEKVAQMEQALKELEAHSCELEAALTKKRAQLNDMTRASSLSSARVALADTMNMLEDYLRHGKSVPADCWKQICSAIDSEYPSFRAEIMEQIPRMKDHMLCTCYLVKLGMNNQQIEILTGSPHQTVWNRVNKIKEALNRMDSASA